MSTVVQQLRTWASRVGELKLSDDLTNPTAAIQLTGIDLEAILDRARHNDTEGERRKLLRLSPKTSDWRPVLEAAGLIAS